MEGQASSSSALLSRLRAEGDDVIVKGDGSRVAKCLKQIVDAGGTDPAAFAETLGPNPAEDLEKTDGELVDQSDREALEAARALARTAANLRAGRGYDYPVLQDRLKVLTARASVQKRPM